MMEIMLTGENRNLLKEYKFYESKALINSNNKNKFTYFDDLSEKILEKIAKNLNIDLTKFFIAPLKDYKSIAVINI